MSTLRVKGRAGCVASPIHPPTQNNTRNACYEPRRPTRCTSLYSTIMRISRMIVIHQLASVCVRSTLHQHRGLARGPNNRSRRGCATTIRTAVQSTARTAFPMEYFQRGLKYLPSRCIQPRRRTQTPADTHHLLRNRALLAHAFRDTKSVRARYWLKVIEFPT